VPFHTVDAVVHRAVFFDTDSPFVSSLVQRVRANTRIDEDVLAGA
jgi:hypothetical protein